MHALPAQLQDVGGSAESIGGPRQYQQGLPEHLTSYLRVTCEQHGEHSEQESGHSCRECPVLTLSHSQARKWAACSMPNRLGSILPRNMRAGGIAYRFAPSVTPHGSQRPKSARRSEQAEVGARRGCGRSGSSGRVGVDRRPRFGVRSSFGTALPDRRDTARKSKNHGIGS